MREFKNNKTYSRQQLISSLQEIYPESTIGSYQWRLGEMLKEKGIKRTGYYQYMISDENDLPVYQPEYSRLASEIAEMVAGKYPHIAFTVFETVLMNEFLNHLVAQNTVFIQAEKDASPFIFRFLQDNGCENIMLKPSVKDFNLYWKKGTVVISNLISEAPLCTGKPHSIMMEKMLVDMYCDKLIRGTYSAAEYSSVVKQAFDRYQIDRIRMLRYARRRNKEKDIARIVKANVDQEER